MRIAFVLSLLLLGNIVVAQPAPKTFCNPLDLNYGTFQRGERVVRHGADPVIVLYKDRYYLFSSWENLHHRVRGGETRDLTLYNLNRQPPYHFRIESVNDGGTTAGASSAAE